MKRPNPISKSKFLNILLFLLLAIGLCSQTDGFAITQPMDNFVVTRTSLPGSKITGLVWLGNEMEVQHRNSDEKIEYYVALNGIYPLPNYDLYAHNRAIIRSALGKFQIKVAFRGKPIRLSLRAVGPAGVLETEEILLIRISKQSKTAPL